MVSTDNRFVVAFNGEIYNYPELRKQLVRRGVAFRSNCDTEALLQLYALDGPRMVDRLRGMFAFAIWDDLRKELFLARDPYGIKPLYYANNGGTFRFASQVKALLAGGNVSRDPEAAGLVGFHLWGNVPEPFTLYRDICALPAGHKMRVDCRGPRAPERYWSIAEVLASVPKTPLGRGDRAVLVAEGARDSVRHHLLADVEVGVFLSAGIDSSAVLGLVRDAGLSRPRAITLSFAEFRGTPEDEAPLAAAVADWYGATHVVRTVAETEFRADLPEILAAMDQPSIDGVNTWFVAKAAREAGLKVALSGLGGDELLAGYPSFTDLPRWLRRYGALARVPGLSTFARLVIQMAFPALASSKPKAMHLLDYAASFEGAYLFRRGLYLPPELVGVLDPDLVREGLCRLRPLQRVRANITPDPGSDVGRVCALESSHYLRDQLLRDSDWAGMAHSLEIRTPLVDSALVERLAPTMLRLAPGEGKKALAAAPTTPLPASIIEREKTGFVVPTAAWMRAAALDSSGNPAAMSKGLASRAWSRVVFRGVGGEGRVSASAAS